METGCELYPLLFLLLRSSSSIIVAPFYLRTSSIVLGFVMVLELDPGYTQNPRWRAPVAHSKVTVCWSKRGRGHNTPMLQ
jgi:hypothetical protein